jgi:CheY-like chemotaxis protein
MPNLDGFGLTAAIRAAEPPGTRLPIIAITANAMQGEAQRCRERGMDDYLPKPLRMNELAPMLDKWMPEPEPEFTPGHTESPAVRPEPIPMHLAAVIESTHPIWNPATLTELVGDNPDMHKRLLAKFLLNAEKQVAEITTAAANRDSAALAGVAHTLKSAARSVGALRLGELCQSLETAARAGDGQQCSALASGLAGEFAAAATAINGHLGLLHRPQ